MAGKLIPLDIAAQQLGISPDELNDLRQRQEIYGYRDGASWKFKQEDIERIKGERARGSSGNLDDSRELSDLPLGSMHDSEDSGEDVVLLSEFEFGESGPSTSSTVLKPPTGGPGDSDLKLATGGERPGASDVRLAGDSNLIL